MMKSKKWLTVFLVANMLFCAFATNVFSQEPNPFQTQPPPKSLDGCMELKYDNGSSEGKQSYGGSCPAIQFLLSDLAGANDSLVLKGFKIYASRYGGGFNPASTFVNVYIIDSKDKVLQKASFPYALFEFQPNWVTLALKESIPVQKSGGHITIVVDPEAHRTKGVFFHYNKNPQKPHSLVATPGKGYKKLEDRQWMIRSYFQNSESPSQSLQNPPPAVLVDPNQPPRIVTTIPQMNATEVDPSLSEIAVTFDQEMRGGMSWTGGPPAFPNMPEGARPFWRDNKTCVLPVTLDPGKKYRVGINSPSHKNFKNAQAIPASPTAIIFSTQGYSEGSLIKPLIVNMTPPNGAVNVDPNTSEIRITFSVPMGGGFSWVGGGPNFPNAPPGKRVYWTPDKKTCVHPVQLKPGWEYRLGLNSRSYTNFRSAEGVPLEPVVYSFKTAP